jgi:hypothetical protein
MIPPHQAIASVSSASLRRARDWAVPNRKGNEWQRDAYAYNEMIGEVGFLHNLTANLVSTCELRVVEQEWTPEGYSMSESTDARSARVMAAFTGPQGGQKELKRRAALHLQIAGESYLLGTPLTNPVGMPGGFAWEFLSTEEVRVTGEGGRQTIRRNAFGAGDRDAGYVDVDAFIARLWRPDPRYSQRADSPMKRVLPICRELVVLSEVVDSVAKSRLSSGLLFVPEEMSFGPINENEGLDNTDDVDEFTETLVQHMSAPVEDRTSAAGLVPLVVRGAAEFGDKIRLVDLARDLDQSYAKLREELLKRLSHGLDAPPEIMTGKQGLNHWSSYNVDADLITKHVNPCGEMIAEFLTVAYLRPMLIEYEAVNPAEAQRFRLVFDSRMLTARSDEGPAATGAWDRLALSDDAYLRSNGFDSEDYPDDDERRRRLLEKVVLADPTNFAPLLLPEIDPALGKLFGKGTPAAQPERAQPVAPNPQPEPEVETPAPSPETGPPEAAPSASPVGVEPQPASMDEQLVDELTKAANAALLDALAVRDVQGGSLRLDLRRVQALAEGYWGARCNDVDVVALRAHTMAGLLETAIGDAEDGWTLGVAPDVVRRALTAVE